MARIPTEELEKLKRQVSLVDLCRHYGIELKAMGPDNLMGRCPFHQDATPSFGVTPSKNLWNCLAGCGGGDTLQLVMRKEDVSFRHAAEILRQRLGMVLPAPVIKTRMGTAHAVLADHELADHVLLQHVGDFYHQTFCNDPKAMKYLQQRKCFNAEAAKLFRIGYANRTLGYRIPPAKTRAGDNLKGQLQRLGILRESGHEHLSGSVVFPITDEQGIITQMYGRKITAKLKEGTPLHLYLPAPRRAMWNAPALRHQKEWLLCESIIDALTLWCAGFRNVTCSYGVNGFTESHWQLLAEVKPQRLVVCYDNDEAGNTAAAKLMPELVAQGITVLRAKLPTGQDINDVACANKNAQAALAMVLESLPRGGGAAIVVETTPAASPATVLPSSLAAMESDALAAKGKMESAPVAPPSLLAAAGITEATKEKTVETPARAVEPAIPVPPALADGAGPSARNPAALPVGAEEVTFTFGPRQWRVRGIGKNLSFEILRVQLRVLLAEAQRPVADGARFHLDTLDLCNAKHRQGFIAQAQAETGLDSDILKRDMGQVLLQVEELQEKLIREAMAPQKKEVTIDDAQREAALALLRDPQLLDRILADFALCGVVGEETNKLVGYLAATSRKLDAPLAVMIQSTSAAGKSSLMEAILAFVPEEQRIKYSAMTGQSLYYLGDCDLQHKVLAIVEEEGAHRASYAIKLLQSEGELTIASTGKDPASGRMVTQEYHVAGPVMIMLTTTAIDIDEELLNRCMVLSVDESREQTRAIHSLQREARTLEGLKCKLQRAAILELHRNAQRLLRPLKVVNPFARQLTFLDDRTRTRRDHTKYLALIDTIALLHQYQRPVKTAGSASYIEVTSADIAAANRLADEALGRSLDELPPQTRRLLALIDQWVRDECKRLKLVRCDLRFSRRDVRQATGWTDFQVRVHLERLVQMEYVLTHRGQRGQCFVYELLYDGQGADGRPFMVGLIDAKTLGNVTYAAKFEGSGGQFEGEKPKFEAPLRPQRGAIVPPLIPGPASTLSNNEAGLAVPEPFGAENARPRRAIWAAS